MAKAKKKPKVAEKTRNRKPGPLRKVPKAVHVQTKLALTNVRRAKAGLESKAPGARAAWRELHNVESRLSRLT